MKWSDPLKLEKAVLITLGFILLTLTTHLTYAVDWGSCQDDLDRLRRASRDAADSADTVRSRADDLESAEGNLRSCRIWSRDCSSEQWRYRSALSDFESAKSTLEAELDTVSSRIRSVEFSCGYDLGSGGFTTSPGGQVDRFCALLRRLKGRIPDQTLMDTCKKSKTDEECKKCLQ